MMLLRIADASTTSAAAERHPARRSVEKERAVGLSSALTVGSTVPDDYWFGGKKKVENYEAFLALACAQLIFRSSIAVSG
jgi:hypothetical protein